MSGTSKKKTRQYSEEFLTFDFITAVHDIQIPFLSFMPGIPNQQ